MAFDLEKLKKKYPELALGFLKKAVVPCESCQKRREKLMALVEKWRGERKAKKEGGQ